MGYHTKIIFGKDEVRKYHNGEAFTDDEKNINLKNYTFETDAERDTFYEGINEAIGWLEYEVIEEFEDKSNQEKEDESKFDYWAFIQKYYPRYYFCDSVLLSGILARKLDGEKICEEDEGFIEGWDVRKELFELDRDLLCEAFENFFDIMYPKNPDSSIVTEKE
ncbi:hypothetical protein CLU83_3886 [Flavobacterium sp. 1]|uniref:hypothetical protein n=1 Tax=Flavobacterium sp. 1 TaxID=2035200 RepID=UPI000C245E7F|nr:hypothetical protein [Flavobacterium sp. 1]PJJ10462.1 hypothetical protein CLU83_3886 [Flavobacterium sp. 1]